MNKFTKEGHLVEIMPDIPAGVCSCIPTPAAELDGCFWDTGSRICNVSYAADHNYFVMNALAPADGVWHEAPRKGQPSTTPSRGAPIYAHTGDRPALVHDTCTFTQKQAYKYTCQ